MNNRLLIIVWLSLCSSGTGFCQEVISAADDTVNPKPEVAIGQPAPDEDSSTAGKQGPKQEPPANSASTIDKTALAGCELHVVGMYMPEDHSKDDRVYVKVKPTGKPIVLVLTGYFGAQWQLNIDPQADVRQIIVPGYYKHEIADPVPGIPVSFFTYFPEADKKNANYFWAYAWHTAEGRDLKKRLKELTGLEITTFQGEYAATRFIVDGVRGKDVVEGVESSSKGAGSSANFWSSLFGGAETVTEPAEPPIENLPIAAAIDQNRREQGLHLTPANASRQNLESERRMAEDQYRTSEETSQQAARDYRAEAAQESPDANALGELKQKLNSAVKTAFEAQMKLQQIRLQIAQRDLADVQAKHQRRESLASKIIERRVADLINGEDLEWPQTSGQTGSTSGAAVTLGHAEKNRRGQPDTASRVALTVNDSPAPELDGEWRLLDVTGMGITAHETGVHLRTSAGKYTLVRGVHEQNFGRRLNHEFAPATIDVVLLDEPDAPPLFSGIYKVEGDKLTIAWAPRDGSALRPTDFSGKTGTIHTFARSKSLPKFATPQELVDYLELVGGNAGNADFEQYISLLTDDEVKRFSGLMLRTASMMQSVAGLVATFGTEGSGENGFDVLSLTAALNLSIEKHRLSDPPPAAQAAYQQIAGGINVLQLFMKSQTQPAIDANVYSEMLRTASGVLRDPEEFLIEIMTAMAELSEKSVAKDGSAVEAKKPADWQITVNGDTAKAVNLTATSAEVNALEIPQTMELVRVGDTWKISSLISDQMIIEMQQGLKASESASQGDATSPSPIVMAPAESAAPLAYAPANPGVNSARADRDIRPYTELNEKNVSVGQVFTDNEKKSALSPADVEGKYVNRYLKRGEIINSDMLIDKPTTEQIVDFWLVEAAAGRDVFEPMRSKPATYPSSYLYGMNFPFSASYARRFNEKLPEWTDEYLRALTKELIATTPENWSARQVMLIRSVAELIHYQPVRSSFDPAELGDLLSQFVILNSNAQTEHSDPNIRKNAHSPFVLGELIRLNGSLPEQVPASTPDDHETVAKLALLKQMAENGADSRWISQEHLRLAGLLEQAPVQALKLLLTSAPIKRHSDLQQWIFAMSSVETYRAYRSSPDEPFSPPVDAVLLIAVAELIAGKEQHTDDNLALIFEQHHPGNMFYRHASDLLESELAYRNSVLKSLTSIYQKSKSESLKQNIAKLAPAVPVMAKQDTSSTAPPGLPE